MATPQKTRLTRRASDWRRALVARDARARARSEPIFREDVRLDPDRITDVRGKTLTKGRTLRSRAAMRLKANAPWKPKPRDYPDFADATNPLEKISKKKIKHKTVEGLDGKPKRQMYRGNRMIAAHKQSSARSTAR